MNCLTQAWTQHEPELRGWGRHRLQSTADTEDLLQGLFLKALRGVSGFAQCKTPD